MRAEDRGRISVCSGGQKCQIPLKDPPPTILLYRVMPGTGRCEYCGSTSTSYTVYNYSSIGSTILHEYYLYQYFFLRLTNKNLKGERCEFHSNSVNAFKQKPRSDRRKAILTMGR